jgi:hypothetical protein
MAITLLPFVVPIPCHGLPGAIVTVNIHEVVLA